MTSAMQTWSSVRDKQCRAIKRNRICKMNFIYTVLKTITDSQWREEWHDCTLYLHIHVREHTVMWLITQPRWWRRSQYLQCWTCISPSSGQSSKISLSTTSLKSSDNKQKLSVGMNTHDDIIINNKCCYFTSLF